MNKSTNTNTAAAAPGTATMKAIVQRAYGSADVLRLDRYPVPQIAADEVLIRVRAAGMDRGTWHMMTGQPYLLRVLGFGFRGPKNPVPGRDVAGVVVDVGSAVTRFGIGDEVFGVSRGSYAEFAAAQEGKLARKPARLSFEQAAVVPISGGTALQAVEAGGIARGQKVLILGASGGVGSFAVQLAKASGAEVTGVCGRAKADLVRSLGADHVLDYARDDFADWAQTYDVILDVGGNPSLSRLRRALTPGGTAVIVGGESGGRLTGGIGRSLRAPLLSLFVRERMMPLASKERASDLERLVPLLESGVVKPSVDSVYDLEHVGDAMRNLEAGRVRGKVAITVA
jgi:NADPH:quinone reductase-like Zn-dependent oxidoreductase